MRGKHYHSEMRKELSTTPNIVCYITDTETTGLSAKDNDVIEISMCRLIPNGSSYTEEQKTWLLRAINPKTIQEEALKINGHKREDILHLTKFGKENYRIPTDVVSEIEDWILTDNVSAVDRIFAGQNPKFDIDALMELWKRCGRPNEDDFPFMLQNGNRVIDTKQIVTLFDACTGRRRKLYNLSALVKATGIKKGKAHQASEDVRMTKDLLLFLINIIKPSVIEQFSGCYPDGDE